MAKPRRNEQIAISLFPFLSILACVIGVLTLVITSLSLSSVAESRDDKDMARAEDYVAVSNRLEEMRGEIKSLAKNKSAVVQKLELEQEMEKLKSNAEAPPDPFLDELRDKVKSLDDLLMAKSASKEELDKKRLELEQKLAQFEELKKKPRVQIQPSGGFSKLKPLFVETRAEGIVIHAPSRSIPVKNADITSDVDFLKLVDYVAERDGEGQAIVFLIRPDGLGSYSVANEHALNRGAGTSKLPLIGQGPVDLRAFGINRKEGE